MNQITDVNSIYGLIGYPLSHSFSQKYFREKFKKEKIEDVDYLNFPIKEISELEELLKNNPEIKGFNVTIPYKEKIIEYLSYIEPLAKQIGAVNTVKCEYRDGKINLKGYNTDIYGFSKSLLPFIKGHEKNALILGYGGAAKTVHFVLSQMNLNVKIASRNQKSDDRYVSYEHINPLTIEETDIIVNTTPLGMWPKIEEYPDIPYNAIKKGTIAYDLIYNPEVTVFLKKCASQGAITKNGHEMLILQAEKSWEIFNSVSL
ncbi:MAG: shikimate dehydrogenase [Bacteroidales bacterium]